MRLCDQTEAARKAFTSVEGWIELGNYDEAANELNGLPSKLKSTTAFVALWIRIFADTGRWENVQMLTETLLRQDLNDQFALCHKAEALHRMGRSADAVLIISHAIPNQRKKDDALLLYALARYLVAADRPADALSTLGFAFDLDQQLRMKALDDPDLSKVWTELQEG